MMARLPWRMASRIVVVMAKMCAALVTLTFSTLSAAPNGVGSKAANKRVVDGYFAATGQLA